MRNKKVLTFALRLDVVIIIKFTIEKQKSSGCSAVGSVPAWGAGGREFESRHPDFQKGLYGPFFLPKPDFVYLLSFAFGKSLTYFSFPRFGKFQIN